MKFATIVAFVVALVGCYWTLPDEDWSHVEVPYVGDNVFSVMFFVARSIEYEVDSKDEWQSPQQTWGRRKGDCEDFATLAMYLLERDVVDVEVNMALSHDHAWLVVDDQHWETLGCYVMAEPPPVRLRLSWEQVRRMIDN